MCSLVVSRVSVISHSGCEKSVVGEVLLQVYISLYFPCYLTPIYMCSDKVSISCKVYL